jgi:hypothetical protein
LTVPQGQAFALTYTSSLRKSRLEIYRDKSTLIKAVDLPATSGNPIRFLVAVEPGARIWGFRVALSPGGNGEIALQGAGTAPSVRGFSISGGTLSVDGSVEVRSVSIAGADIRIPENTRSDMDAGTWIVSILRPAGAGAGRVTFAAPGGRKRTFEVDRQSSPDRIDFGRQSIGFLPVEVIVDGHVESVQISQVSAGAPLPSDPGLILAADPSLWRRPDFELYRWSLFPRVLIFDTASYGVQDGLFNRLAFFVEKAGHTGRIEDPATLAGTHGYNAHDYRAEDLARFFTAAARDGVALTSGEGDLRRILLDNGIIQETKDGFEPGSGCVISISRSSNNVLRELLLTHESFHGVYFSLPMFRSATGSVWEALSPVEQEVWLEFLSSQNYDTSDNYLVENEFQAYLLQQERSEVPGRQALMLARMKAESSRGARLAAELERESPSSFLRSFDALEEALRAAGGPPGGLAIAVKPVGPAS